MFRLLSAVAVLLGLLSAPSEAQRGPGAPAKWVLLGKQSVGFGIDRDVIRLGHASDWFDREGPFRNLRFNVERNDIHLINVQVVYLNGYAETFRVDRGIRAGQSVIVDLKGDRSFIREIGMVYRSRPNFKGQATVTVYGEAVRRAPPVVVVPPKSGGPRVELLGQQSVGFGVDRDVVRVGANAGAFRRIAIGVEGNDVEFISVRVVYANGQPDNLPIQRVLRAGERSGPLDLQGDRRRIDRVELLYRSRPNFRGQAVVKVYGVH